MVLLGIIGQRASGKKTIGDYISKHYNFMEIKVNDSAEELSFADFSAAVDYATSHWNDNFYIISIDRFKGFDAALKRPFFVLLSVDAPPLVRYLRFRNAGLCEALDKVSLDSYSDYTLFEDESSDLQKFLISDQKNSYVPFGIDHGDNSIYNSDSCLNDFFYKANIKIKNKSSLQQLYDDIDVCDVLSPEHTRPTWDT